MVSGWFVRYPLRFALGLGAVMLLIGIVLGYVLDERQSLPSVAIVWEFLRRHFTLGSASFVVVVGAGASILLKYVLEIQKDNRRRRVEVYYELRKTFDTEKDFLDIQLNLDSDSPKFTPDSKSQRMKFASFMEYVSLCTRSDIFSHELANYEFGYFAMKCWNTDTFWVDLVDDVSARKEDPYSAMFKTFVDQLMELDRLLRADKLKQLSMMKS
jgi:hypothetical protein